MAPLEPVETGVLCFPFILCRLLHATGMSSNQASDLDEKGGGALAVVYCVIGPFPAPACPWVATVNQCSSIYCITPKHKSLVTEGI